MAKVDTEFILFHTRRDLGMRMGIHFRVDTKGDRGYFIFSGRQLIDDSQLNGRFHVKAENIIVQS